MLIHKNPTRRYGDSHWSQLDTLHWWFPICAIIPQCLLSSSFRTVSSIPTLEYLQVVLSCSVAAVPLTIGSVWWQRTDYSIGERSHTNNLLPGVNMEIRRLHRNTAAVIPPSNMFPLTLNRELKQTNKLLPKSGPVSCQASGKFWQPLIVIQLL